MRRTITTRFVGQVLTFFILPVMSLAQPRIEYSLGMSKPHTHLLEVGIRVSGVAAEHTVEYSMPAWRTGRYVLFDFAGGVREFTARDAAGKTLSWHKKDKDTWVVSTNGADTVTVEYQVYADEFNERTRGLDQDHAFVDGAAVFMYVEKFQKLPVVVDVTPYPGWHVTTGLDSVPGTENRFHAPSYEVLADSPIEVGTQRDFVFEAEGKQHVLMIAGEGNWDGPTIVEDLKKIIRLFKEFWGSLPYERYVFMLHVGPNMGGGTEHLNSTIMQTRPFVFKNPGSYRGFLGLVAHEFFHTWNVKALRPAAYHPYDFSSEGYSRELWIAEGTTSYYSPLLMLRGGYSTVSSYLGGIAASVQQDRMRPGNRKQSLTQSSFDAWIKFWRGRPDAYNAESDYYDKGADVSQILDLEIRHRSKNAHSLDDVMRVMYTEFSRKSLGYTVDDFQRMCERFAGSSLQEFFDQYVHGTEPLPWERVLSYAGLELTPRSESPAPFLGFSAWDSDGRSVIRRLIEGSPAANAGISDGDELIALNGYKIRGSEVSARVAEMKVGDIVRVTVFRNERLREFDVTLGAMPVPAYTLEKMRKPSALQKAHYESWLGAPWDDSKKGKK